MIAMLKQANIDIQFVAERSLALAHSLHNTSLSSHAVNKLHNYVVIWVFSFFTCKP